MADTAAAVAAATPPPSKKRRAERRQKLAKTALCKHYGKPEGCPFPNCKFAHGRDEVLDGNGMTVAAQRELIREQSIARAESRFTPAEGSEQSPARMHNDSMIERYYTELYVCDANGNPGEDQYVHMHSNRICVLGIAESHPVMQEELEAIDFSNSVLGSKVSGKKKKGGQFLLPDTILCVLKCKSGKSYTVRSCIRGSLLEINEQLFKDPSLLQRKHKSEGYLAIAQPKQFEVGEIQEGLLSKDEYMQLRHIRTQMAKDSAEKQDASKETAANKESANKEVADDTRAGQ